VTPAKYTKLSATTGGKTERMREREEIHGAGKAAKERAVVRGADDPKLRTARSTKPRACRGQIVPPPQHDHVIAALARRQRLVSA